MSSGGSATFTNMVKKGLSWEFRTNNTLNNRGKHFTIGYFVRTTTATGIATKEANHNSPPHINSYKRIRD